ncbi:uncharacterized protein UHOD_07475 [Ustilago sp. UG-2017b]|nr:uncharacterized protein UHOD_07475 [Ustilago sp. UG-2017b]
MPIPLVDGSVVGDGSQLGIFPALADQSLDKPFNLLRSSTNPRMDLVLLIVKDAAASSGTAAAAPPGMSVAQFALVQRMLAARQRGAAAASGGGAPEPKRGPQIHLVLWRMGDDSSIVWSVPLSFDKAMDPPPGEQGASQQEHEDVHLHDLTWSPKGDRVALLASVRRSPVASSSTTTPRTSTLLRTYSVQDGRLLSTVDVQSHHAGDFGRDQFTDMMTLQWLDIDFAISNDAVDGSSESLLAKLPPLPALPAADTFASARGTSSLMPHQLRMMQMNGQKPPPSFQYPSHLALQGRGALAKLPYLAKSNSDLGLLEGGDACFTLDDDSALPLLPETVVLVANANSARATLVLDGQTSIGSLQFQQHSKQDSKAAASSSCILSLSHDMTQLTSISAGADTNILYSQLSLPLPLATRYGPSSIRHQISAVSRASHLLRFYLGYALDSASALQQVYQKEVVQKVTKEWTKNIDDLSSKFGGDMKYELINVLLTGRAGPAAEQFLLANLTEGVLARLEQQSHTAMYAIKKLISESLRPALERCIVCLTGLLGQVSFFGADDGGLREGVKLLQVALDSSLSLAKDVDLEALISQEFYRWFRTERERQERIKQDQDEPRLPVTYDVHFVASYIDRGFENEQLRARMADTLSSETLQGLLSKSSETKSLSKALEEARTFLAATSPGQAKGNVQKVQGEKKAALAIVPVINKAVEVLGAQLVHLLDGDLGRAEAEKTTISITPAIRGWSLTKEPTPALSLSSSIHTQGSTCRISTASYLTNETLITAYPLQSIPDDPASTTSILALRFHALVLETAHFTISTDDNFSILDLGFYGDAELLILATLLSTSTSVLLAFNLADLPFSHEQEQKLLQLPPSRAIEFDKNFKAGKLAVNTNKQTVAVTHEKDAMRIVYLDISFVEVGGMPMQEQD